MLLRVIPELFEITCEILLKITIEENLQLNKVREKIKKKSLLSQLLVIKG